VFQRVLEKYQLWHTLLVSLTLFYCGMLLICFRVAEIMEGKGAGKKGRFQGKINKIQKRTDVEKMLREHLGNNQC